MKKLISFTLLACLYFNNSMAQCVEGNCHTGQGSYIYPSGAKYTGQFINSKIEGLGTLWMNNGDIYTGSWINNYRQGQGKMIFKNGNIYKGNFFQSKLHGYGIMKYGPGGQYSGYWSENLPQGKGQYEYANKEKYDGDLKEGRRHGFGTYYYENGEIYTGQWQDNLRSGKGSLVKSNGLKINGTWLEDQWQETNTASESESITTETSPIETFSNPNSQIYSKIRNCNESICPDGYGEYTYQDGSKYQGNFKNGNPFGQGIVYYANGDRYEGGWNDIAPDGEGIMYFKSGRVYAAIWNHGRPVKQLEYKEKAKERNPVLADADKEVKIWTVIVGIARYAHMPALKYADDDAYQIYAFLKSPEGGAIPDNQIKVLIDEDATRENILQAMHDQFGKADANDVVMMYYSGHGVNGSFLPIDFDGYKNKLFHEEVTQVMEASQAKHKLCMVDACYAGSMADAKADFSASLNKFYNILNHVNGGMAFILSCKEREVSLEDSGLRQGIFSHYLIRGLKGESDLDHNQIITVQELYDFIFQNVRRYTGNIQTPMIEGKYNPLMPVAMLRQ